MSLNIPSVTDIFLNGEYTSVEFILHVSILWKAVSPRNLDFRCFQTSRELRRLWQLQ